MEKSDWFEGLVYELKYKKLIGENELSIILAPDGQARIKVLPNLHIKFGQTVTFEFNDTKPPHARNSLATEIDNLLSFDFFKRIRLLEIQKESYFVLYLSTTREAKQFCSTFLAIYPADFKEAKKSDKFKDYSEMPLKALVPLKYDVLAWTKKIGRPYDYLDQNAVVDDLVCF